MLLRLGYDFNAGITNSFPGEERIASDEEMAGMARVVKDLALSRKGHLETYFAEFAEHARAVEKKAARAIRKAEREKEEKAENKEKVKPYGWENYQDDEISTDSGFSGY
ncbi:uncharacterized protein H6S33_008134 [Morchella sextelata]|uniref:uncharacterized protein n=1 Tax=Morchella sextelata TaxID=1174677 RepID=UPI001D052BC1|nr:uncharacterized protein H6S33_008134 [Morchella sextelata]KAH0603130.1 hypothetical protein H6S33_008134 [Morchella sextelata]